MTRERLSADQARRIAIAAQGLDRPLATRTADARHLRRALLTVGALQLDFVNVLVPAHYLVIYSRVGAYRRERLHRLIYAQGEFIEQWAHEASIVPASAWPLLEHRRRGFRPWRNSPIMRLRNRNKYLSQVYEIIEKKGPVTSKDLPPVAGPARRPGDWHRSVPRWALEYLFGFGAVAVCDRRPDFQRVYDLPERVIEDRHRGLEIDDEEAQRVLLRQAAGALGVATISDLADYYRMSPRAARPRVQELADAGDLHAVRVDGWREPAYLAAGARLPREVSRAALLSPFDPLVWCRPRALRLFDFHYRLEIYVPEPQRRWGYYVLPFLLDDRLVARVDLKAERKAATLLVRAAHLEAHADVTRTAHALAGELGRLAAWLGLASVSVEGAGELAPSLAREIAARCARSGR